MAKRRLNFDDVEDEPKDLDDPFQRYFNQFLLPYKYLEPREDGDLDEAIDSDYSSDEDEDETLYDVFDHAGHPMDKA